MTSRVELAVYSVLLLGTVALALYKNEEQVSDYQRGLNDGLHYARAANQRANDMMEIQRIKLMSQYLWRCK